MASVQLALYRPHRPTAAALGLSNPQGYSPGGLADYCDYRSVGVDDAR